MLTSQAKLLNHVSIDGQRFVALLGGRMVREKRAAGPPRVGPTRLTAVGIRRFTIRRRRGHRRRSGGTFSAAPQWRRGKREPVVEVRCSPVRRHEHGNHKNRAARLEIDAHERTGDSESEEVGLACVQGDEPIPEVAKRASWREENCPEGGQIGGRSRLVGKCLRAASTPLPDRAPRWRVDASQIRGGAGIVPCASLIEKRPGGLMLAVCAVLKAGRDEREETEQEPFVNLQNARAIRRPSLGIYVHGGAEVR
jgi:hypothetical protein